MAASIRSYLRSMSIVRHFNALSSVGSSWRVDHLHRARCPGRRPRGLRADPPQGAAVIDLVRYYLTLIARKTGKGQGLVEYELIVVLIAVVSIAILGTLGTGVASVFSQANSALSGA